MKKITYIDVHCHLDMIVSKIEDIIKRAKNSRVGILVPQGVNPQSNRKVLDFRKKYACIRAALGIYPTDALKLSEDEIKREIFFIKKNRDNIVAIGEVGLDFKESNEKEKQIKTFERIIELAKEIDKPLIVHSRKAELECIELLERRGVKKAIMHCFTGKFSLCEKISKNGWYLSIPTNVTYSEHFQNIARKIDIKSLFCETDSPFLHPKKKKDNEPANVIESYKKIAELKNIKIEEVAKEIMENYSRLFGEKFD